MKREGNGMVVRARELVRRARAVHGETERLSLALELAAALLAASEGFVEGAERERREHLRHLMADRRAQVLATVLTDRVHRCQDPARVVGAVRAVLRRVGVPGGLPWLDRVELRALRAFGSAIPGVTAAALRKRIYEEARPYVVPAEADDLGRYLASRRAEGVRVNLNLLGEEVLGEDEARRRQAGYLELLGRADVDTISVKLSSICSQIDLWAWEHTLGVLAERLRPIYEAARDQGGKLVYLDMEAYRDLELTVELFQRLLGEPGLVDLEAGIAIQAYLPDALAAVRRLFDWAARRRARGGAPIRVRVVKGANLAMERIEAAQNGWALPTFDRKPATDASYQRLLRYLCVPERAAAVTVGVGSHNVFDLAYALVLRASAGVEDRVQLEMLEGMADGLRRAVQAVAGGVLVYTPVVEQDDLPSAVAYLVRRLDENTGEDNFLRHAFSMRVGDETFRRDAEHFAAAHATADTVSATPRRAASRFHPVEDLAPEAAYRHEPDTDFAESENRRVLADELRAVHDQRFEVPLQIAGRLLTGPLAAAGFDPSRPALVPYRHPLADEAMIEEALACAVAAAPAWANARERPHLLREVARGLRRARAHLVALMVLDAGKRAVEADAEVSEAVDFAEYYARSYEELADRFGPEPLGVVLVTPPWNFPLSIPMGGVLAALVAGNTVVFKPAPETVLVAHAAARICWEAGIPREVLQLIACTDGVGSALVRDRRVAAVVLTGGTATARAFLRLRPGLRLLAETGGKNPLIVSAMSDREQAALCAVHSAFAHAGQKCSAASLLILEREVYESGTFRALLADATRSLVVGSAWQPESFVTPLIRPPSGVLARALATLEPGESWLVEPRVDPHNPRLVSPGIKWGVSPRSFTHTTELFGPVLGVMAADDLEHALELAAATPYGLCAGLFSLDEGEQERFLARMDAGNLYVNRVITGAIVGRQPFGGRKASSFGPGAKAGGPHYLAQLCRLGRARGPTAAKTRSTPSVPSPASPAPMPTSPAELEGWGRYLDAADARVFMARLADYRACMQDDLGRAVLTDDVLGEENLLWHEPGRVLVLAMSDSRIVDLASACAAARLAGASLRTLAHPALSGPLIDRWREERLLEPWPDDDALGGLLSDPALDVERLRIVGTVSSALSTTAAQAGLILIDDPVPDAAAVELHRYLKEKSAALSYHRYGHLGLHRPCGS